MAGHIHRVTVRGRFRDLTPDARAALEADAQAHDVLAAAFTPRGTLTYEPSVDFFTFRYEIRTDDEERGLREAGAVYLGELEVTGTFRYANTWPTAIAPKAGARSAAEAACRMRSSSGATRS